MEYQVQPQKSPFATASMLLGIIALLTLSTVFLPLPLAALGILFASLAHKKGQKRNGACFIGLTTSCVALIVSLSLIIGAISMIPTILKTPEYRKQLNAFSEQLYGQEFDEMIEDLYGIDPDELFDDL